MGIKISELPEILSGGIADENQIPTALDGTTYRIPYDKLRFDINTIPYAQFNNGSNDITLNNWGFWTASDECSELYNVNMPDTSIYGGKLLILYNRTNLNIPISGIQTFDGSLSILPPQSSYVCFSIGLEWILMASL